MAERWRSATGLAFGDFLFNLLPLASEAQYSDGARLWQMYRRGPWCDFHCANYYMGLSQTTPLRPREWPTPMVERAAEFAAQLPQPAGSFAMAYAHFLDRGDWQRAVDWLERAHLASEHGSKFSHALAVDRAFIEAFHRRDGLEAKRWFEQASMLDDSTDYWRSAATVRAIQGDLTGASEAWTKASKMVQIGLPPASMTWIGTRSRPSARGWNSSALSQCPSQFPLDSGIDEIFSVLVRSPRQFVVYLGLLVAGANPRNWRQKAKTFFGIFAMLWAGMGLYAVATSGNPILWMGHGIPFVQG